MVELLKQCYFCESWFPSDKVNEVRLQRHPSSIYEDVFTCESCQKNSAEEKLIAKAVKALNAGAFNEIELSDGDKKVHLIRFTPSPVPLYPVSWNPWWHPAP